VRQEDIVARWAGDEFVILLPQTGESEVKKVIDRIKDKLAYNDSDNIPLSIGLGYAVKKETDTDIYKVLNEADNYLYKNKMSEEKESDRKIVKNLLESFGS
ncbi:MAG: GGDEF domain-containing protein, partial [Halarsenatibacteraceae bacterium]